MCVPCFSQETQERQETQDIDTLIKWDLKGLNENFDTIQLETVNLDETERLEIYNRHKKNIWGRGLMSLIPYGIGSFINGDSVFGDIVMVGEILGGATAGVGAFICIIPFMWLITLFTGEASQIIETGATVMKVGGIIAGAFYLFGIIRGFYYPYAYNKKLKAALWPDSDSLTVSIIPSVDITENDIAVTLVSLKW